MVCVAVLEAPLTKDPSERDFRWAAKVGELCGRAGTGLAPDWGFLDSWLELTGSDRGVLTRSRPGRPSLVISRGLECPSDLPLGLAFHAEAGHLSVVAQGPKGATAALVVAASDPTLRDHVAAMLPLIEGALLRLAAGPQDLDGSIAAWNRAPTPMLLLDEALELVAANPAATRRLKLPDSGELPGWLTTWAERQLRGGSRGREGTWTAHDGAEAYHLSVANVSEDDTLPGRWLVSIERGGPTLEGRLELAQRRYDLTPRERQCLELVAEGLTNKEVASALNVSAATVKFHLVSVMRKVGVASRTELLARLYSLHVGDDQIDIPPGAFRLEQAYLFEDEDGIIHWIQDYGARMDASDVEEFIALLGREFEGRACLVLSDATGVRSATRASHKAAEGPFPELGAAAMLGGSRVSRAIINLWLSISTQNYPVKMFSDRTLALEWLRSRQSKV